jgi:signal transduction histidine kinase
MHHSYIKYLIQLSLNQYCIFELYNGNNNNNNNKIIVEADKNRLSQVISNLLNNAIKFTDEGNITVIVGTKIINNNSNKVIVSIKDTGTVLIQRYCQNFLQNLLLNLL